MSSQQAFCPLTRSNRYAFVCIQRSQFHRSRWMRTYKTRLKNSAPCPLATSRNDLDIINFFTDASKNILLPDSWRISCHAIYVKQTDVDNLLCCSYLLRLQVSNGLQKICLDIVEMLLLKRSVRSIVHFHSSLSGKCLLHQLINLLVFFLLLMIQSCTNRETFSINWELVTTVLR